MHKITNTFSKEPQATLDLIATYDPRVISWLDNKVNLLLTDYLGIRNSPYGIVNMSDYSYLITPAFKALEGTLIQIARELGLNVEKADIRIGVVFSEENLEMFYQDVLNQIEDLSKESKADITMWLNDARRFLRHFRHSPAHYGGDTKQNWDQAFADGDHVLRIINGMCSVLLESGVFEKAKTKKT